MDEYVIKIFDNDDIDCGDIHFEKNGLLIMYTIENVYTNSERHVYPVSIEINENIETEYKFKDVMLEMFPHIKNEYLKLQIESINLKLIKIGLIEPTINKTIDPAESSMTDWARAKIFADNHRDIVRYSYTMNCWYIWDGKRWKPDHSGGIFQLAKLTIHNMYNDVLPNIDDYDKKKKFAISLVRAENQHALKAMLDSASNEPDIPIDVLDFDKQLDMINVNNGVVCLNTGKLLPHDKNYNMTKMLSLDYDRGAKCDTWLDFLNTTFQGDSELIEFIQRFLGYSLTGYTDEQVFCIFYGHGSNGKGTLIDTVMNVMGEYAKTTEPETIIKKKYERSSTNDLADLWGSRFVTTSETETYQELDEGRIKRITGQDPIKCRFLYKELFEYIPEYKLILLTNHEPIIKSHDYSIWRRVLKVPFNMKLPREQWNLNLRRELLDEREGIFNWLVKGAVAWKKDGLKIPDAVIKATEEYKEELDVIGDFITMCADTGVKYSVKNTHLYKCYEQWCEATMNKPFATNTFSRALIERGFSNIKINGMRGKKGIDIKNDVKILIDKGIFCQDMQNNDILFLGEFEKSGTEMVVEPSTQPLRGTVEDGYIDFSESPIETLNNKKYPKNTVQPSSTVPDSEKNNTNRPFSGISTKDLNKMLFLHLKHRYPDFKIQNFKEFTLSLVSKNKQLLSIDINDLTSYVKKSYKEGFGINQSSQIDKIKLVKDIIKQSSEYNEIIKQAEIIGIDTNTVDSILNKLRRSGQVMNPSEHVYQLV